MFSFGNQAGGKDHRHHFRNMRAGWGSFGGARKLGLSALDCVRNIFVMVVMVAMAAGAETDAFETAVVPVLKGGCISCHNNGLYSGGLNLEAEFSQAKSLTTEREAWGRILKRVKNGTMPPRQMPRPAGMDGMIAFLEKTGTE
jgi:hypothetical protein